MQAQPQLTISQKYNALIIDDDLGNIRTIKKIIADNFLDVEIKQAVTIDSAIAEIKDSHFDFIILESSVDNSPINTLFEEFNPDNSKLIFLTNNKEYAFDAFAYNPVDFVLKPFKSEKLVKAITKAIKQIDSEKFAATQNSPVQILSDEIAPSNTEYLAISSVDKIDLLNMKSIVYCEAEGKYTSFFTEDGKKYVASRNIGDYAKILNSSHFFRVHHSYIINLSHVHSIEKREGKYCVLKNGATIPFSKRRYDDFSRFLKLKV